MFAAACPQASPWLFNHLYRDRGNVAIALEEMAGQELAEALNGRKSVFLRDAYTVFFMVSVVTTRLLSPLA